MQSLCNVRTSNVFLHEKDTDRARLHKQSDRQKKNGRMDTIHFACNQYYYTETNLNYLQISVCKN